MLTIIILKRYCWFSLFLSLSLSLSLSLVEWFGILIDYTRPRVRCSSPDERAEGPIVYKGESRERARAEAKNSVSWRHYSRMHRRDHCQLSVLVRPSSCAHPRRSTRHRYDRFTGERKKKEATLVFTRVRTGSTRTLASGNRNTYNEQQRDEWIQWNWSGANISARRNSYISR